MSFASRVYFNLWYTSKFGSLEAFSFVGRMAAFAIVDGRSINGLSSCVPREIREKQVRYAGTHLFFICFLD